MRHTDANFNVWYDGVTLTNCTYVHCKDGCTGTFINCNFVEIGENNVNLTLDNVNYCTIGSNNKTVTISNSDYIIVGSDCENILMGSHDPNNTRFTGRTGANSLVIGHKIIGAEITGCNSKYDKSKNVQADGTFNKVVKSGVVFLDKANGNQLNNSSRVDLELTNNNTVETINLNLGKKAPFNDYALIDSVTRVQSIAPVVNRQSDATGEILDLSLNTIINEQGSGKAYGDSHYTNINGKWVLIEDN